MKAQDHPEYSLEWQNLQCTLTALNEHIDSLTDVDLSTADEHTEKALFKHYRDEYLGLQPLVDSPYFGRFDFAPCDEEETESYYIGKKGFEHNGRLFVLDWRAPAASLFYRGKPGDTSYGSPGGTIRGQMQLKRNLDIQQQQLLAIADDFDIRPTARDAQAAAITFTEAKPDTPGDYLRAKLAARRDPYLQDIIATIQAQQYDLIQADPNQVLVIQGVAGSGKTSVGLHRLAYLLHPGNAAGIDAKRCIIFGPNRLFLSYIRLVLPQLEVGQVTQTTLADWACDALDLDPHQLTDRALEVILSANVAREEKVAHYRRSQLRNSHRMGQLLERYSERRRRIALPENGLTYTNIGRLKITVHLGRDLMADLYKRFEDLSLRQHQERFVEALAAQAVSEYDRLISQKLEEWTATGKKYSAQAAHLREESTRVQRLAAFARGLDDDDLTEKKTAELLDQGTQGLQQLTDYYQKRSDTLLSGVGRAREEIYQKEAWQRVVDRFSRWVAADTKKMWPTLDIRSEYMALLADERLLSELGKDLFKPDELALLREPSKNKVSAVDLSDLPAMHFLHVVAEGTAPRYDHVVIDEAQDVSRLQLETIRRFSRNGSLTILGDLPQSIYAHRGIATWDEVQAAFAGHNYSHHEITKSYRTTYEITVLGNAVLKSLAPRARGITPAEPFERHGETPHLHPLRDPADLPKALVASVNQIRSQGYENIAIITKTARRCQAIASQLRNQLESFAVIESPEVEYRGGAVILPVYLAKGMEFEVAFVVDVDEANYSATEYDGRLLYVAVTRPLHVLHLFWAGEAAYHLTSVVERRA